MIFPELLDIRPLPVYNNTQLNQYLQGRVRFPTGGTAHEPQGMIRCDSEADSIVWMREDY